VVRKTFAHILFRYSASQKIVYFSRCKLGLVYKHSFMKQQVRELLVTAKVAKNWNSRFNEKVEELMLLVNKVDTDKQVHEAGELLDVYHKTRQKPARIRKKKLSDSCCDRPFEFFVFCN